MLIQCLKIIIFIVNIMKAIKDVVDILFIHYLLTRFFKKKLNDMSINIVLFYFVELVLLIFKQSKLI